MGPAAAIAFKKVGEFFSKPSGIIVLVIIAVLVYVYFKGKKAGKEKAAEQIKEDLKVDVNNKLLTSPGGDPWSPSTITDRLHDDIYSGMFTPRDIDAYKVLLAMPDEKIKAVHNDWMARYFDEDNETLKVAISHENAVIAGWNDTKEAVLAKFTSLGLR
jgi:hypothetical protein